MYQPANGGRKTSEPLLGESRISQLLCFFKVQFPTTPSEHSSKTTGRFAAIRPMVPLQLTASQLSRGMPRLQWSPTKNITIIRIGSIQRAACVVPILPSLQMEIPEKPSELLAHATKYILNTKVDCEMFANVY